MLLSEILVYQRTTKATRLAASPLPGLPLLGSTKDPAYAHGCQQSGWCQGQQPSGSPETHAENLTQHL